MTSDYRHKVTPEQKRMTERELAAAAPEGMGVSIRRFGPYWDVVLRLREDGKSEYIVTDSSRPEQKPLKVYGPTTVKDDAITWARTTALLFVTTHGQMDV